MKKHGIELNDKVVITAKHDTYNGCIGTVIAVYADHHSCSNDIGVWIEAKYGNNKKKYYKVNEVRKVQMVHAYAYEKSNGELVWHTSKLKKSRLKRRADMDMQKEVCNAL